MDFEKPKTHVKIMFKQIFKKIKNAKNFPEKCQFLC